MSLKSMNKDELKDKAMIDLATIILTEEKKAMDFHDIFAKIADIKGFSEDENGDSLVQFYTDLNVDGQFLTVGSNMWGLKRWYPVDQIDEDITAEPKKKKTKKKKTTAKKKKKIEDEMDMEDIVVDENMKEDYDNHDEDYNEEDFNELDDEDLDEEDYDDYDEEDDLDTDDDEEEDKEK